MKFMSIYKIENWKSNFNKFIFEMKYRIKKSEKKEIKN